MSAALSVREAARRACVSEKTIRRAVSSGALAHERPAGVRRVLILEAELERWRAGETAGHVATRPPRVVHATSGRRGGAVREQPGSLGRLRAIEEAAGQ